jgi:hypothetical protein
MNIKALTALLCLIGFTSIAYTSDRGENKQSGGSISYCQLDECKLYFKHFTKAAKRGHAGAMATLGQFYYIGYGTEPNESKAISFLKKASRFADKAAQYKLGLIYLTSKENYDLDASIKYLNKAAKKDYKDANLLLGTIYYNNQFTPQNFALADKYLSKSFQQRHPQLPAVISNIKAKVSLDSNSFPLLSQKLSETPLTVNSEGAIQWPESEIETITITSPPITQILDASLLAFRRAITTTGSRIPGISCTQTVGCIQTSARDLFNNGFPPGFLQIVGG